MPAEEIQETEKVPKQGTEEVTESEVTIGSEVTKKNRIYRTPLFTKLYSTNLKVFQTDVDVRIEIFNEKSETKDETVFFSDGLVILTLEAAKKLSVELNELLEKHEAAKGEITITKNKSNKNFTEE